MADKKSIGPSYLDVANRYKNKPGAVDMLAQKVIKGGSGVWGEHGMSAHPQLSVADARAIVEFIMTTGEKKAVVKSAPVKGSYEIKDTSINKGKGTYVLRAAYRDKGTAAMAPLLGEQIILLRHPSLDPELADVSKGYVKFITPSKSLNMIGTGSYIGFNNIDLHGIEGFYMKLMGNMRGTSAGSFIEIRLDAPDGALIGKTDFVNPTQRGQNGAKIDIAETEGLHTVYFVFVNDKAPVTQTLLQLLNIDVLSKQTTPVALK
jgi:cytochrome c